MAAVRSLTITGTGTTGILGLDYATNPFNVGLSVNVTGTSTYSLEVTLDDPMDAGFSAGSALWQTVPSFSGLTAKAFGSLTVPAKGIRINASAGTGTITLYILQATSITG